MLWLGRRPRDRSHIGSTGDLALAVRRQAPLIPPVNGISHHERFHAAWTAARGLAVAGRGSAGGVLRKWYGCVPHMQHSVVGAQMSADEMLDMTLHARRRAERMRDPEYRAAYERAAPEIAQSDQVIRALDELRLELGMSKAELARRINRNASSIRRLFTAQRARPELPLVAAIADALGAEIRVVPREPDGDHRPAAA